MKKSLPLCILLLLFSGFAFGQTKKIDSLKNELLKPSIADTTKISLYLDLSTEYYPFSADSLGNYAKLAVNLSKSSNNYLLESGYSNLGTYYIDMGEMDSARINFKKAMKILELKNNKTDLASTYSKYAVTLRDATEFEESIEYNLKAIKLREDDKFKLGESQYNLAIVYSNSGYDSLSVKYLKLATKSAEESNHEFLLSYTLSNLVYYSLENNKPDVAKPYLDRCLELCKKLESPRVCNNYYLRAGLYYDKIEKFDEAELAYNSALSEVRQLNDIYDIIFGHISLGEHFVLAKKPKQAIESFKKSEKLHNENPTPDLEVWAYEHWAKAEKMIGNFKNSNRYLERYVKINDSLNSEKNKTSIANAETKYQSEKKDKEIAQQQLELADQKLAIQKSKSKTRTMTILIGSLLLGSILLWFSFNQRQKRMQQ